MALPLVLVVTVLAARWKNPFYPCKKFSIWPLRLCKARKGATAWGHHRVNAATSTRRRAHAEVARRRAEAAGRPASPRPADPAPLPNTSCLAKRPLGTLQWTPMHCIYKQIQKLWPKGLAHGLKEPFSALVEIFWTGVPLWTSCTTCYHQNLTRIGRPNVRRSPR